MKQDLVFLKKVYQLAWRAAELGFDPFAAMLVKDGKILATSIDKSIEYVDPTAHAELVLISEFCRQKHLISLEGYTLYCNVEPCVMCSGAIHWAKISRVVYGLSQRTLQQFSGGKLKPDCRPLINVGGRKTQVLGPMAEEEGMDVFRSFPFRSKKERLRNRKEENNKNNKI